MKKDVTNSIIFENPDDELLPVIKCVCGKIFDPWAFTVCIYEEDPIQCPQCGRKFIWTQQIKVFEVG